MAESLTEAQWAEIESHLYAGRKIEAIKVFCQHTGSGLKDAKEILEEHERELRERTPDRFAKAKGCVTVLVVLSFVLLIVLLAIP